MADRPSDDWMQVLPKLQVTSLHGSFRAEKQEKEKSGLHHLGPFTIAYIKFYAIIGDVLSGS